jgi:hypothetical protein
VIGVPLTCALYLAGAVPPAMVFVYVILVPRSIGCASREFIYH